MPTPKPSLRLLAATLLLCALPATAKTKPAGVDGAVTDETGVALAGVQVVVTSPEDPDFRFETQTNDQGRFSVEIADPRTSYLWRLQKDGYEPYFTTLEVKGGERRESRIA